MTRVLVVGGGPAGASCALEAARGGLEVVLFEAESPDRDKVCGDGLLPDTQKALAHFGLLEEAESKGKRCSELTLYALRGEEINIALPFISLRRKVFDHMLRNAAIDAGVDIHYQTPIQSVRSSSSRVEVVDRRGESYQGDVLVLATGAIVNLAKQAGFTYQPAAAVAVRGYMRNARDIDRALLWFTREIRPAYAWAAPSHDSLLNVGLGYYFDDGQRNVHELLAKFVATVGKDMLGTTEFVEKPRSWPLRAGLRSNNYNDRILLIGENTECVFDFTGEGIGKAMQSGIAGAQTILQSKAPYDSTQLSSYSAQIEAMRPIFEGYTKTKELFSNPLTNYAFTKLLQHSGRARRALSAVLQEKASPSELFSLHGFMKNI